MILRFNLETGEVLNDFQFEIFGDPEIAYCQRGSNIWIRVKGSDISEVYVPNIKGLNQHSLVSEREVSDINIIPDYDDSITCFTYEDHLFGNTLYSIGYDEYSFEKYFCDGTNPHKQWGWANKKFYSKLTTEYLRYKQGKLNSYYLSKVYLDRFTEFNFVNQYRPWQCSLYFSPEDPDHLRALTICPDYFSLAFFHTINEYFDFGDNYMPLLGKTINLENFIADFKRQGIL